VTFANEMNSPGIADALLQLSHEFGVRQLVILGEGNTSARCGSDTFLVKASGSSLETLTHDQLTECSFRELLALIDREEVPDVEIDTALECSKVEPRALKPSVETFFHAYLLTLPGVEVVGHAHPIPVNQILCSPRGKTFAQWRQCPDEVVCCGPVSVLVPYVDPGLMLARRIRNKVESYMASHAAPPRVILLENHGVITLGTSPEAVRAAMLMTVKAAEIFVGAHSLGAIRPLPAAEIARIESRLDEAYRRQVLKL
jgi:rhamnose utilization protein RhaD (predicted bifunctional aldolase and dehydrogenase)